MLITRSNIIETGVRKRTIGRAISFGPISLRFVTILILAAFALFYLAQSTQSATRNYKIQELEREKKKIEIETERLRAESFRLRSLNNIQEHSGELGLE